MDLRCAPTHSRHTRDPRRIFLASARAFSSSCERRIIFGRSRGVRHAAHVRVRRPSAFPPSRLPSVFLPIAEIARFADRITPGRASLRYLPTRDPACNDRNFSRASWISPSFSALYVAILLPCRSVVSLIMREGNKGGKNEFCPASG